ncbi:MAG: hypothetical protein HZR80_11860 [Candidatus Heimdallarchaeota archaeon]
MSEEENWSSEEDERENDVPTYDEPVPPPPDEKFDSIEETPAEPFEDGTDEFTEEDLTEEELRKHKRKRWLYISIFGIALPIVLIILGVVFFGLLIVGVFETCIDNCASQICAGCCEGCEQQCAQRCDDACGNCCENACEQMCADCCEGCGDRCCENACSGCCSGKITPIESLQNTKNLLKWIMYSVFSILK